MLRFITCVALFAALCLAQMTCLTSFSISFLTYILTGGWSTVEILMHCIPRDIKLILTFMKMMCTAKYLKKNNVMLYDYLTKHSEKYPNKPAYISAETGEQLTFKQANELANKVANYFYDKGYRQGDVVALMMENRIEYIPIWLGISKIGVVTALINTNLKEKSLQHCIEIAKTKALIYTPSMQDSIKTVKLSVEIFEWETSTEEENALKDQLIEVSCLEPKHCIRENSKPILYIYTSGTTGLPKAAIIKAFKLSTAGNGLSKFIGIKESDICYNVLPLYHGNGGYMAASFCLYVAASMVIRRKFSASNFFKDACKYECTCFNYIGEICRYILAQPEHEFDRKHKIRFATGNGLKASIWKEFQNRFNVPNIFEFFGSIEGNLFLINTTSHVGSIGFYPLIFRFFKRFALIKVDENSGEILRGVDGLGIQVKCGEPGMLVSKIDEKRNAGFDGYVNKKATEKKIAYGVISKGDSVFVFGDMLYTDKYGYFYFADRLGDTFRWKGENVSTNEVEGVISKCLHLNDVCVYGVEINGIEGKAGMACIVDPERKVDLSAFSASISMMLPTYARPMFLRFSKELEVTGTFKFQKTALRKESYDPSKCGSDLLYYFDLKTSSYVLLNSKLYDNIQSGKVRF